MRLSTLCAVLVFVLLVPNVEPAAAQAKGDDAGYLFALAQIHRFEGSYDEALDAFKRAVAAVPDDAYVRLEFAEFLFQLGKLEDAAEHAEAAYRAESGSRDALRLVGRVHLRQAEHSRESLERAREAFEELRRLDPSDIDVRVTLGRLYLSRSQSPEAAAVLREARNLRPGDRLIVSLLVEALGPLIHEAQILEELTEIVTEDPGFLQPRLTLSQALNRMGNVAAVVDLLEDAPEEVRSNVEYLRQLSSAYYRAGALEDSLAISEQWLERRPQDTMGKYLRALTLAGLGRDGESEEILSGLLEENPDSQEFALLLAEIVERRGRPHEAAELLRRLAARLESQRKTGESRRVTAILVDLYARSGEWEEILELTKTSVGMGLADQGAMRFLRCRALEELGREEEALSELEELAGVQDLEERVAARRATILFSLGRHVEAEQALDGLSESEDVESLMLAAEVLHGAELFARAVPVLQRADQIDSKNLDVIFWLAASFERSGRLGEAEDEFRRLLQLDGEFAPALNYLGYMWAEQGQNLEEALDLVTRAVALEPHNGAYLDSLGWAYYQSGQLEEAREHLERAAQLVGDDAVVFEHLGDLYLASGDRGQAEIAYRKALDLEGDNWNEVRRKLSELDKR